MITAISLPFLAKKPIDLPPIVSVELIQITDKTNIPFAPKAKKTIEKIKEKEKKLVSEQAPPKKVKKDKKKETQTDPKKNEISKLASKKTPTTDLKKEKLKKDKLNAVPLPEKEKQKIQPKEEKKTKTLKRNK